MVDMARLSINQITVRSWSLPDAADALVRHGVRGIGVWLDKVEEIGLQRSAALLRSHDLTVSSVCRAGFFTSDAAAAVSDDNLRAIEIAHGLDAACLYVVCGGMAADNDLGRARARSLDGLAAMAEHAHAAGVKLALEPLHPMMTADRSVVVTLDQALDMVETIGSPSLGVAVDSYNVWWDPRLPSALDRSVGRVLGYQVCDWLVPQPHPVFGRGIPGDGVIDLPALSERVASTDFDGMVEVEIFNEEVWASDPDRVIDTLVERASAV